MVCLPSRSLCTLLNSFVPLLGWCVRLPRGSWLPSYPLLNPFVPPSWMVCPSSRGLWLPLYLFLTEGTLSWMGCPPSRGSWIPLYPFLTPFVPLLDSLLGWCVCLLEGIDYHCTPSWMVSICTPSGMVCQPSQGSWLLSFLNAFVPPFLMVCPLRKGLDFLFALSWMVCLLTPTVPLLGCGVCLPEGRGSHLSFFGWCVRLLEGLDSHCPPSQGSCFGWRGCLRPG